MIADSWRQARHILAVRLDNLGDVLMTGPALRSIKRGLPDCRITLLSSPGGEAAAQLLPWVDEVTVHRALWQDLGSLPFDPSRERALAESLAQRQFDAAVIFTSFNQSPHPMGYVCYLAGIPLRVGASKEFGGAVLSHEQRSLPQEDGIHQVDRNLALLEPFGFDTGDRRLQVQVPPAARTALQRSLTDNGLGDREFVAVSPWASCSARTYRPEAMAEAAARIAAEAGCRVVLTGGSRHQEEATSLLPLFGEGAVDLTGRLAFTEFAALLERASLLLTNNSGPMHLADALATPMVVLYSGTELESQWEPRGGEAELLRRPTSCQPCYSFVCPFEGHPCLAIPVDEVVEAGLRLLGSGKRNATPA